MQAALNLIYPNQCCGCSEPVEGPNGLCAACWRDTPFIEGAACHSCGAPLLGEQISKMDSCDDCLRRPRNWGHGCSAMLYQQRARKLVLLLKHAGREDIGVSAGLWMARASEKLLRDDSLLVPVPLHWSRMLQRRYNQALVLARGVGAAAGVPVAPDALIRTSRTARLDSFTADERFDVMAHAIQPNAKRDVLRGRSVLLVDDVMTTGATLSACAKAAMLGGASCVDVLTLARAAKAP